LRSLTVPNNHVGERGEHVATIDYSLRSHSITSRITGFVTELVLMLLLLMMTDDNEDNNESLYHSEL